MLADKLRAASLSAANIQFVGSTSGQNTSGTPTTVTKPTGVQDDDLVLLFLQSDTTSGGETISTAGWFPIATRNSGSGDFTLYGRIASSDGATYSISHTLSGDITYVCAAYRNAFVNVIGAVTDDSSDIVTLPSLTAGIDGSVLLGFYGTRIAGITATTPSGMSLVKGETGATGFGSAFCFSQDVASGSTGTRASTLDSNGVGCMIVLAPTSIPTPIIKSSSSTKLTSSATSVVVAKPSGTKEGDLLVAFMSAETGSGPHTWTQPSGWSEVADQANEPSVAVSYKVATSSEPANYTFTFSTSDDLYCVICRIPKGAYDVIGTFAQGIDPIVAPSVTVSQNNSLLLAFFSRGGSSSATLTLPSGMSLVEYERNAINAPVCLLAYEFVNAGSTGTRTSDADSSSRTAGIMLAIKPA